MEPAQSIIRKLGGPDIVRSITKSGENAPYRWQYPKERGGTGGVIPQRYHRTLLDYAKQKRIKLKAEDFLPVSEEA